MEYLEALETIYDVYTELVERLNIFEDEALIDEFIPPLYDLSQRLTKDDKENLRTLATRLQSIERLKDQAGPLLWVRAQMSLDGFGVFDEPMS